MKQYFVSSNINCIFIGVKQTSPKSWDTDAIGPLKLQPSSSVSSVQSVQFSQFSQFSHISQFSQFRILSHLNTPRDAIASKKPNSPWAHILFLLVAVLI